MQPGAIFHLVSSTPGSNAAADAKKPDLTLASIAQNSFLILISGTLQPNFCPVSLAFSLQSLPAHPILRA
ncbi:hypothetical protein FIBSPDRAFT_875153 [Athelia psychrophila]|uniref:Uncharacterized protein n=1 Tax=Athelia psychrophila TaxID=1759441 RepID=A0A165WQ93_9AGAM|nr:hypothetical protein FIBSPDRAFT_875153 [Fibularhizoctonia sp. CBS 109695]